MFDSFNNSHVECKNVRYYYCHLKRNYGVQMHRRRERERERETCTKKQEQHDSKLNQIN